MCSPHCTPYTTLYNPHCSIKSKGVITSSTVRYTHSYTHSYSYIFWIMISARVTFSRLKVISNLADYDEHYSDLVTCWTSISVLFRPSLNKGFTSLGGVLSAVKLPSFCISLFYSGTKPADTCIWYLKDQFSQSSRLEGKGLLYLNQVEKLGIMKLYQSMYLNQFLENGVLGEREGGGGNNRITWNCITWTVSRHKW